MSLSNEEKFRQRVERLEEDLEPYALKPERRSKQLGRGLFREGGVAAPLEYRTEYHRDRDRIVWSKSFKRLQHKTQIFPHYVEDHYRRRLTHSLEVAQVATTLARALGLNEVATEAMALGHDLGHTPFGHAGETALNKVLKTKCQKLRIKSNGCPVPIRGFDHCVHAIEVVSRIEQEYTHETDRGGLNLTFDVRDGILKHMFDRPNDRKRPLSSIASVTKAAKYQAYGNNKGSLEAQCVYFADKTAYLLGDTEDGIRSTILRCQDITDHEFFDVLCRKYAKYRNAGQRLRLGSIRDFPSFRSKALTVMILDCIDQALMNLNKHHFMDASEVLDCQTRLIWVSDELSDSTREFYRTWMEAYMFKHEDVVACGFKAEKIVTDLFNACYENMDLINKDYRQHCQKAYADVCDPDSNLFRLILARNYVAGMTDSFAIQQHARLFMSSEHIPV